MFDISNHNAGVAEQMCIMCLLFVYQQTKSYTQASILTSALKLCESLVLPQDDVTDTWLPLTGTR